MAKVASVPAPERLARRTASLRHALSRSLSAALREKGLSGRDREPAWSGNYVSLRPREIAVTGKPSSAAVPKPKPGKYRRANEQPSSAPPDPFARDLDQLAALCIFDRILDQILDDLHQFIPVALDDERLQAVDPDLHPGIPGEARQRVLDMECYLLEVGRAGRTLMGIHLNAAQRQEIIDQPLHAFGLVRSRS